MNQQKHILVVDDDLATRFLLKQMLEDAGYRVSLAEEGQSAMQAAWSEKPDLVVTDMDMPVFDGKKAMAMFSSDETLNVPVVVVSGTVEPMNIASVLDAGAAAFFPKPVDRQKFLAAVAELLSASG